MTDQLTLTVGYDIEITASGSYRGETVLDPYGRKIPKHAHGTATLGQKTSSVRRIVDAVLGIYDEKADPKLTVRRLTVTANRLMREEDILREPEQPVQFSLFDDPTARERQLRQEEAKQERERRIQEALLDIKKKYGKMPSSAAAATLTGRPHASGTARSEDTRHERKIRRYHRPAASRAADASADAPCATARRSSRPFCGAHRVTAPPLRRRSAAPPTRRSRRTSGSRSRSLRRRACIQGQSMFGRSGGNTGAIAPRQNVRRRSSHPAAQCH